MTIILLPTYQYGPYAEMWSDYDTFYLKASLMAFHNGDLVFEKEFNEEIQRLGH